MTAPTIQAIEPFHRPPSSPSGSRTIARFVVDLGGVRMFGLQLRQKPDGSLRVVAPNLAGQHTATFEKHLAEEITTAAMAALKGGRFALSSRRN